MPKHLRTLLGWSLLLGLAWGLRLLWLDKQSLWYDEGVTWYLTRFTLLDLIRWTAADIQPPLYYLTLWGSTRLFGFSEWALRFPSAVFGLLTVPVMARLGGYVFRGNALTLTLSQRERELCPPLPLGEGLGVRATAVRAIPALLTALAPLLIYYSQEARMYSLLVLQATLGSYLLLHLTENPTRRRTLAYILVMASALYTHYFAAFLVIVHALYALSLRPRPRTLSPFLGISLLFSPWLPILLARLGDDPSYWPGTLKLNEILLDVLISFAVGGKREMILESVGAPLALAFGLALLLSLTWLGWQARRGRFPARYWLFLLAWLILPIGGVILLSYQTPKFNPRYTMLAWPAFILILSGGLASLFQFRWNQKSARFHNLRPVLGLLALSLVLGAWLHPLRNWFPGPASFNQFSKDDFRSTAQFVRERSQPSDTILLSSGHLFPVWQYYFGPENWTPLPNAETLDVNQVISFDILPQLQNAVDGHSGVWLVGWQNHVTDPNRVLPLLLDTVGDRRDTDPFYGANFWGVNLNYWRLPDPTQPITWPEPYPALHHSEHNFGNVATLRGLWQAPGENRTAALLWQARQAMTQDYQISLRLRDEAGVTWSDGTAVTRPAAYLYPTYRWQVGPVFPGQQILPWLPGTPPGQYWLEVGWLTPEGEGVDVLDASGNPQGRIVQLGPLTVTQVITPVSLPEASSVSAELGPLSLLVASLESGDSAQVDSLEAGASVVLDALWATQTNSTVETVVLQWTDSAGQVFTQSESLPARYPAETRFRWRPRLSTPYQAEPGPVSLAIALKNGGPSIPLAELTLRASERNFAPPESLSVTADANFGGQAILLGAQADSLAVMAGESTPLTLYWQAAAPFQQDYTVFLHALGPDGRVVINADHAPPRPTSNWLRGEIIADPVTLTVPPDLPPGRYPLEVGLYNAADPAFARLPLRDSGATYIILTELEVLPRP